MRPLTQRAMEPTKASFATTQWDQEVESATAPDGHVRVHQSQAAPFSVGLPSGLARSQQLYMMQRFLNIPATPSYVAKDDGLVLDRVVVNVGGRSWWQTLTLRLRAQRAWNTQEFSKGKPHQVLGDPSMYALGGRFRVGFGAHTVLRGLGELGSLSGAVEDFRRFKKNLSRFGGGEDSDADASRAANARPSNVRAASGDDTFRGRVQLQTKAFAGHLVSLDASLRERYQTPRKYIDGPSFVGASVRSRGQNWFNYRLGVRHWLEETLPAFEMSDLRLVLRPPPRREATAGCSVEHQATLWRGERRAPRRAGRGAGRGATRHCRRRPASSSGVWWARPRASRSRTGFSLTRMKRTSRRETSAKASPAKGLKGRSYAATSITGTAFPSPRTRRSGRSRGRCWTTPRSTCGTTSDPRAAPVRVLKTKTRLSSRTRATRRERRWSAWSPPASTGACAWRAKPSPPGSRSRF